MVLKWNKSLFDDYEKCLEYEKEIGFLYEHVYFRKAEENAFLKKMEIQSQEEISQK